MVRFPILGDVLVRLRTLPGHYNIVVLTLSSWVIGRTVLPSGGHCNYGILVRRSSVILAIQCTVVCPGAVVRDGQ